MKSKFVWTLFFVFFISVFLYLLINPKMQYGGDLIEYFGMTESVLNHGSLELTPSDKTSLTKRFGEGYFKSADYYPANLQGTRYSSHFFLYSFLNIPTRLVLKAFHLEELNVFRLTNTIGLCLGSFLVGYYFLKKLSERVIFFILLFLSPLMSFIVWPGPELMYTTLILLGIFCYFHKKQWLAILLSTLATWQSQPLMFIPLTMLAIHSLQTIKHREFRIKNFIYIALFCFGIVIPNIYYLFTFGQPSPFTVTQIVGTQFFTFKKVTEVIFDPNIGLLFYAPFLLIMGVYGILKTKMNIFDIILLVGCMIIPLFFFPFIINWNHGTAGYGPTRYALYLIPFLIYFALPFFHKQVKGYVFLALYVIFQIFVLSFNGFLMPHMENSFKHTPYAGIIMNLSPGLYNPSPEIFIERTLGKEVSVPDTAIYKVNGVCKKAFIIKTNTQKVWDECGQIPSTYTYQLKNEFLEPSKIYRALTTTEATLYPSDGACDEVFVKLNKLPYVCLKTTKQVLRETKTADISRWQEMTPHIGVWTLKWGKNIGVTIPPGYTVHHHSMEGIYVPF